MEYTSIKEIIDKIELSIPASKKVVDAYIENKHLMAVIGNTQPGGELQNFNLRFKMRMPV